MSLKFIYVVNLAGVTHVLKVSDKRAAGYLDLARRVEDDLATVRDLFVEKGPFLLADKQDWMQQVIEDVSFALKRTVTLFRPAKVEQIDGENIQINTKTPWILDSTDPKAAATFGRLQLVHQKLRTVIYDLEYIQAAAQLESPDLPASWERHSHNASTLHSPVSQTGVWTRRDNMRSSTSLSTLNLTPVPGDASDLSVAPSYASTVSEIKNHSASNDQSSQAENAFGGRLAPRSSNLLNERPVAHRESFSPAKIHPSHEYRTSALAIMETSEIARQPPAYTSPSNHQHTGATNTQEPPTRSNPRVDREFSNFVKGPLPEPDNHSRIAEKQPINADNSAHRDVRDDVTARSARVDPDIPSALRVCHTKPKTMLEFDLRSRAAPYKVREPSTLLPDSGNRPDRRSHDHALSTTQKRTIHPPVHARKSQHLTSVTLPELTVPSLVEDISLEIPENPLQNPRESMSQSKSGPQAGPQIRPDGLAPGSAVQSAAVRDNIPTIEESSEWHCQSFRGAAPDAPDASKFLTSIDHTDAETLRPLQTSAAQVPHHAPTAEQHSLSHHTHKPAPNYDQPPRSSRFRDADMNRGQAHDPESLPHTSHIRFSSMDPLQFVSQASRPILEAPDTRTSAVQQSDAPPTQNPIIQPSYQYRTRAQLPSQMQATDHAQRYPQQPPSQEVKDRQRNQVRVQFSLPDEVSSKTSAMHQSTSPLQNTETIDFAVRSARPIKNKSTYQTQTQKVPSPTSSPQGPAQSEQDKGTITKNQAKSQRSQSSGILGPVPAPISAPSPMQLGRHNERFQHFIPQTTQMVRGDQQQWQLDPRSQGPPGKHERDSSEQNTAGVLTALANLNSSEPPTPPPKASTAHADTSMAATTDAARMPVISPVKFPAPLTLKTYLLTKPPAPDPPNAYVQNCTTSHDNRSARPSTWAEGNVQPMSPRPSMDVQLLGLQTDNERKRSSWAKVKNARQAFRNLDLRKGRMDRDRAGAKIIKMPTIQSET